MTPTTIRGFAERLLRTTSLDHKLEPPQSPLDDSQPGPPVRISAPGRPASLQLQSRRVVRVPPIEGMRDPAQRARILHALANHELQAAELFAWALLAFADAPTRFRRGLLGTLVDEQVHCRLYLDRLAAHGRTFGEFGVTGHFWNKIEHVTTPLEFVCTMGLTFENANLDFASQYAAAARAAGDEDTGDVLDRVHTDEIRHVRFAWTWLTKLKKPNEDPVSAYKRSVTWPLGLRRARGVIFDEEARKRAGLTDEFIAELAVSEPTRPGGGPRRRN